ncbi:oligopeptide ABC transporter permease [Enterococcus olivae]
MWKTILRRLIFMIPQVIILSILIFLIAQAMPGDPFTGLINPNQDPAVIERMRETAGLNDPWYEQYFRWVGNALQGEFGSSFLYKLPVATLIGNRISNTLWMSLLTVIITYLIAVPLGMLAGRYQDSWLDKTVVVYNFFSFAVPLFIFALITLFIFGYRLGWFPTSGSVAPGVAGMDRFWSRLYHMILPSITGALLSTSVTIQYLRNEVIDSKSLDYVKTARSKGVPTNRVFSRHIFRNAALPIASQMGYEITSLIAGSVVIEQIFSYPGVGNLFIDSIVQRDYSVITALTLILGIASLVGTLLSDIIMSIVDPRIRIQ